MKRILYLLLILPAMLQAQQKLSLTKAYELAQQHYPLIKQRELLQQTTGINIDNLQKGYLPQLSISGQATYQSEVTSISLPIPGASFTPPSKDQYKILADVNQLLYDGGNIKTQKNIQRLNEDAEQQKLEVELYKLKDRINQLFLGVLYLDEQMKQVDLVKKDLNNGIARTEAQVNNGVAFRSNLNVLKAELLKADQRTIEIRSSKKTYIDVLALFVNMPLSEDTQLQQPSAMPVTGLADIQRPELKLFSTQEKLLGGQYQLIDVKNRPKANLFVQGGYGRPGLNFLNNDFSFFYTAGVRVSWTFGGLYTKKKERQLIDISKKSVIIQKETFLLNTQTVLQQQQGEADKLNQLISKDEEIIDLRIKVKEAAKAQLENGVITANDYLREVNAEDQARQSLITHKVLLLQTQINYQTTSGKQ